MKKADLAILEKVFAAEIEGKPLMKSKSKRIFDLEKQGMVKRVLVKVQMRNTVYVEGWELTHIGRFTFCDSCKDFKEPEECQ